MPSFLARLQSAVAGESPRSTAGPAADPDADLAPAPEPSADDAAAPTVPDDLLAAVSGAPTDGPPEAVALDADGTVACWALRVGAGATALELRDALRSRLPGSAGDGAGDDARWWPVVALDDDLEAALTEPPEALEELSDLDVEAGPALLDQRWDAAADRAAHEERQGLHSGTTPAETVAAVARALVGPPAESGDDVVAVVLARGAWQLPALLGWSPVDSGASAHDLSAVLQYWEEQWGAELVALGAGSLVLRVSDPPATADDATAVAQELLAVAPLLVSGDLVEPLPRAAELLAPALLGAGWWRLDLG